MIFQTFPALNNISQLRSCRSLIVTCLSCVSWCAERLLRSCCRALMAVGPERSCGFDESRVMKRRVRRENRAARCWNAINSDAGGQGMKTGGSWKLHEAGFHTLPLSFHRNPEGDIDRKSSMKILILRFDVRSGWWGGGAQMMSNHES